MASTILYVNDAAPKGAVVLAVRIIERVHEAIEHRSEEVIPRDALYAVRLQLLDLRSQLHPVFLRALQRDLRQPAVYAELVREVRFERRHHDHAAHSAVCDGRCREGRYDPIAEFFVDNVLRDEVPHLSCHGTKVDGVSGARRVDHQVFLPFVRNEQVTKFLSVCVHVRVELTTKQRVSPLREQVIVGKKRAYTMIAIQTSSGRMTRA